MDLAAQFKEFLVNHESSPSSVTVKNYLSDVNKFIRWFEKYSDSAFDPQAISKSIIQSYRKESLSTYSLSSVERSFSSLRKFFLFLKLEGYISGSPFDTTPKEAPDPWKIKDFKNHLYVFNASYLTIKNYIIDVKQFAAWADAVLPPGQDLEEKTIDRLNHTLLEEYKRRLLTDLGLSPVSVNRKLSSLRKYLSWARSEGLIGASDTFDKKEIKTIEDIAVLMNNYQNDLYTQEKAYSSFFPARLFQKTKKMAALITDYALIFPLISIIDKTEYFFWILRGRPVFKKIKENDLGIKNFGNQCAINSNTSNTESYRKIVCFQT